MKDVFYFEMDGKQYEYHVKDDVPFSALLGAIDDGFKMCFMEDGKYYPELFDFAKEYVILSTLTDIKMPDTGDEAYKIIRAIDGVRSVDADFIFDGMLEKKKYYEKTLCATMSNYGTYRIADTMDVVAAKLNSALDAVNKILDNIGQQVESGELSSVQTLLKDLSDAKGITPEQMVTGMLEYNKAQKQTSKKTARKAVKKTTEEK